MPGAFSTPFNRSEAGHDTEGSAAYRSQASTKTFNAVLNVACSLWARRL